MTEYVWQPVGNTDIDCNCERYSCGKVLYIRDNLIGIQDLEGQGNVIEMELEDGITVCERVPAPQAQGVSVPVNNMPNDAIISVLHAALILYITECRELDDPDGETMARKAQQWLDSQRPSQGQEVE